MIVVLFLALSLYGLFADVGFFLVLLGLFAIFGNVVVYVCEKRLVDEWTQEALCFCSGRGRGASAEE